MSVTPADKGKKEFRFDLNRCTTCGACVIGCQTENYGKQGKPWRRLLVFNEANHPALPRVNVSLACNHCENPACLRHCPAAAYAKDAQTGAVVHYADRCMGCKYCTWACPYGAPVYNEAAGVVEKCDFCFERQRQGEAPACVTACPLNALKAERREEASAAATPKAPGLLWFNEEKLKPALQLKDLRTGAAGLQMTALPQKETVGRLFSLGLRRPAPRITLAKEWTLFIFTTIAFVLVAMFTAHAVGNFSLSPYLFLGTGVFAMALSAVHLGNKVRMYRAVFNLFSSWLSREIFFMSVFMGGAALYFFIRPEVPWLGRLTVGIGFVALLSVDRLYHLALQPAPLPLHSAHVLLNGLYLSGLLLGNPVLFAGAGVVKLTLYVLRKGYMLRRREAVSIPAGLLRVFLGFAVPPVLLFVFHHRNPLVVLPALAALLLGEVLDRMEYYDELDLKTPEKGIYEEMKRFGNGVL